MSQLGVPRWALSLADLMLLLLGFFVILYSSKADVEDVAVATRRAFDGSGDEADDGIALETPAAPLFEDGEARLTGEGRARFARIGRDAASKGHAVEIESMGTAGEAARFDNWELAAARAAAAAHAVEAGGLAADRIEIVMPPGKGEEEKGEQHLRVVSR